LPARTDQVRERLECSQGSSSLPSTASVHSAPLASVDTQSELERLESRKLSNTAPHNLGTSAGAAAGATAEKEEREKQGKAQRDTTPPNAVEESDLDEEEFMPEQYAPYSTTPSEVAITEATSSSPPRPMAHRTFSHEQDQSPVE